MNWNESDTFYIPDFTTYDSTRAITYGEFLGVSIMKLYVSYNTALDEQERNRIVARMTVCSSAISLLTLAQPCNSERLTHSARELAKLVA